MAKEHLPADQRLLALEQTIPGIQRALDVLSDSLNTTASNVSSTSGLGLLQFQDALVNDPQLEQLLKLLRILFSPQLRVSPPPSFTASSVILDDQTCIKVIFDGDVIKQRHKVFLEDSGIVGTRDPNDCFNVSKPLVYDGHAEIVICCKKGSARDCGTETGVVTVRDPAVLNPGTTTPKLIAAFGFSFGCPPQPA